MDYFSRKSLSKYLMNTIEFNKDDVDIFINGTWQKYAGNIGSKLQGYLNFALYARVQFYAPQASDYRLISKTDIRNSNL